MWQNQCYAHLKNGIDVKLIETTSYPEVGNSNFGLSGQHKALQQALSVYHMKQTVQVMSVHGIVRSSH